MSDKTPEFPRTPSSVNGTETVYSVEARTHGKPLTMGEVTITDKWGPVHFTKAPLGVPVRYSVVNLEAFGVMNYAAAQALRWWFHAATENTLTGMLVETRLVEHQLKYSADCVAGCALEPVEGMRPKAAS